MLYAVVLAVLVKLLIATESPRLCAGFFTAVVAIGQAVGVVAGASPWSEAILAVLAGFVLSYGYFWLLNRFEAGSLPWWMVLVGGPLAVLFL